MPLGLYIHIPFCSAICHYCDFAKTANFDQQVVERYFSQLESHLQHWLSQLPQETQFSSVFFGGGTPGLFAREYEHMFSLFTPKLISGAEVTLEANPNDVTPERVAIWRDIGVNRLSMGVQTFDTHGLKFLTREHSADVAIRATELALTQFPKLNIDLIYGWQGQTPSIWQNDLEIATKLGVPHLSLYTLTYESGTVIGRRRDRGLLTAAEDDALAEMYEMAREHLAANKFIQDEVSNWAMPGHTCAHNWLYWSDKHFLAIGSGAHGYLPEGEWGKRYAYPRALQSFLKADVDGFDVFDRSGEEWLTEYVGSSLRTNKGTDTKYIQDKLGRNFVASPVIDEGLRRGLVRVENNRLILTPAEWFRETAWSVEVIRSFPFPEK